MHDVVREAIPDFEFDLGDPTTLDAARAAASADAALLSVTGCQLPRTAERLFKSVSAACEGALEALRVARAPRRTQS